jgi:hypothetical protein
MPCSLKAETDVATSYEYGLADEGMCRIWNWSPLCSEESHFGEISVVVSPLRAEVRSVVEDKFDFVF